MNTLLLVFGLFTGWFGTEEKAVVENEEPCAILETVEGAELKSYAEFLIADYDLENMTKEEMIQAKADITEAVSAKAEELGVDITFNQNAKEEQGPVGSGQGAAGEKNNQFSSEDCIITDVELA